MPQKVLPEAEITPLDRIDRALLALLRQNARLSNKALAEQVGLSESATLGRVRRMVEDGVLTGFHAEVSPKALGLGLQAMIAVRLGRHKRETVERFTRHCASLRPVVAVFNIAGRDDFLVHVRVADSDALRELILASISTHPDVIHVETHLIFEAARGPGGL